MVNTSFAVYIGIVYSYLPFMVLPLYSNLEKHDATLLEAAVQLGAEITPAAIGYRARGVAERELCWFDETMARKAWRLDDDGNSRHTLERCRRHAWWIDDLNDLRQSIIFDRWNTRRRNVDVVRKDRKKKTHGSGSYSCSYGLAGLTTSTLHS